MDKAKAYAWLQTVAEGLDGDSTALAAAWGHAWSWAEEADPQRWKDWVQATARRARDKATSNPAGLWITILKQGPDTSLAAPSSTAIHASRAQETDAYIGRLRQERELLPPNVPPLLMGLRARQAGRPPKEVYDSWLAAGAPPANQFTYPFPEDPELRGSSPAAPF